ncbi:hypothetical protein TRIUR3_11505 [Triticum urartu]|uniref:Essential protein Yae1 N-terminal domain-containing protein n=1 Tax=Triticum urartu TaxID=4572 RepID=M7YR56_TRIUA|nr:hypothetical protein TRIUR3_11505 [Triticum urartu]
MMIILSADRICRISPGRGGNGEDAAAADDDSWCDASDSTGHDSSLHREWTHRQDQFHKMGYRDGMTEGQKDAAQEGFNLGHRQSADVGYKWGLVRGITRGPEELSQADWIFMEHVTDCVIADLSLTPMAESVHGMDDLDHLITHELSESRLFMRGTCDKPHWCQPMFDYSKSYD